jgi:purine-binding chemotaxis protein CheW
MRNPRNDDTYIYLKARMFSTNETSRKQALLVCVATHTCALDLAHVVEIMRPLPIEPVAGAPEMVRGLSAIRGAPVPVVGLDALFNSYGGVTTRFVVVRAGERRVALAVDAVLGICALAPSVYQALPPLLRDAARGAVDTIAALDSELYFVLNTVSIVPDERWQPPAVQER